MVEEEASREWSDSRLTSDVVAGDVQPLQVAIAPHRGYVTQGVALKGGCWQPIQPTDAVQVTFLQALEPKDRLGSINCITDLPLHSHNDPTYSTQQNTVRHTSLRLLTSRSRLLYTTVRPSADRPKFPRLLLTSCSQASFCCATRN